MLLYITNLKVTYRSASGGRREAVAGVSLSLREGEILSLVGGSGSGKSTLGFSIARLTDFLPCSAQGSILLKERNVLEMTAREIQNLRRHEVAYVFQEPGSALNPVLTVGEQVKESAGGGARAGEALEDVGFRDPDRILRAYPHELSGGMKQRAVIAMALAKDPALLVADEPTTALDSASQKEILKLLGALRSRRLGVLFITHDLNVACALSDRILVMQSGRIVDEIKDPRRPAPSHPYTRKLLNCAMAGRNPKAFFEV